MRFTMPFRRFGVFFLNEKCGPKGKAKRLRGPPLISGLRLNLLYNFNFGLPRRTPANQILLNLTTEPKEFSDFYYDRRRHFVCPAPGMQRED